MKPFFIILSALLLLPAIFLLWTYVRIPAIKPVLIIEENKQPAVISVGDTIRFLSWNIGYAGLGGKMDFFFDGGEKVRAAEEETQTNMQGIIAALRSQQPVDLFLLQEVDKGSWRSWNQDQVALLSDSFPDFHAGYAWNYDVAFVPVPLREPMGRVHSGLLTLSHFLPAEVVRYDLPGRFSWPKQMFMPYRCLLMVSFPVDNGKKLVVFNLHNSAFDPSGNQRDMQVARLRELVLAAHAEGHYVVVGGDWNQSPARYAVSPTREGSAFASLPALEDDVFEGWQVAWDAKHPTNRALDRGYTPGVTGVTVIDYFLCSPNIEVLDKETVNLDFRHSDHHPVKVKIRLLP